MIQLPRLPAFSSKQELWRFLGKHFGYPPCCIEAFVQGNTWESIKKRFPEQKDQIQKLGYVPCLDCITRYIAGTPFMLALHPHKCECYD